MYVSTFRIALKIIEIPKLYQHFFKFLINSLKEYKQLPIACGNRVYRYTFLYFVFVINFAIIRHYCFQYTRN